jgi:hypothetical protein
MGIADKFSGKAGLGNKKAADVEVAQAEAPHLERVNWYRVGDHRLRWVC